MHVRRGAAAQVGGPWRARASGAPRVQQLNFRIPRKPPERQVASGRATPPRIMPTRRPSLTNTTGEHAGGHARARRARASCSILFKTSQHGKRARAGAPRAAQHPTRKQKPTCTTTTTHCDRRRRARPIHRPALPHSRGAFLGLRTRAKRTIARDLYLSPGVRARTGDIVSPGWYRSAKAQNSTKAPLTNGQPKSTRPPCTRANRACRRWGPVVQQAAA